MSVDSEQQVVKLGTSTDMGFCRARKKVTFCLLLPTMLAFHAKSDCALSSLLGAANGLPEYL